MDRRDITAGQVDETVRSLRPSDEDRERVRGSVADIVDMVRTGGDAAIRRLTARFDAIELERLRVRPKDLARAARDTPPQVMDALGMLASNLRATASETMPRPTRQVMPQGQVVSTRPVPVDRAGVYAPGGLAAYPSSAVMAIVPAQVAGVREIAVCSPPGPRGLPASAVLAACHLLGVEEVYAIGGAQAVAALALGTETIAPVDVLVGPGNAFVEEAKRGLFGEVGIESLAGPSELVVIADGSTPADVVAWDLRAQAEHGAGAISVLLSADAAVLDAVAAALGDEEAGTITLIHADSNETAIAFVNRFAPEHLQLMVERPDAMLEQVRHAGAIFLGPMSGTAFGDYVAGSNHILPTGGRGRFSSGLAPGVFVRIQEVVEIPQGAVAALAAPLADLARAEGLPAHARSAEIRAEQIAGTSNPLTEGAAS
ncbi:MAG TPA: histidinol dehydrogenase [Gaiellales bacterium]|nr:histidinol dehydrogenase [Gaiellales bacterium]